MSKTSSLGFFYALILTFLLNFSFTGMFANTFKISYNTFLFGIITAIFVMLFSFLNLRKKVLASIIGFVVTLGLFGLAIYTNTYEFSDAIYKIYNYLRHLFTGSLPIVDGVEHDVDYMALMLGMLGSIPAFATTWAIMRRKSSLPAIFLYLIYFIPEALDLVKFCPPIWYILSASGIVLLGVFECVRKHDPKSADLTLLIVTVPLIIVNIAICIYYPVNGYSKDKTAIKQYTQLILKVDKALGTDFKRKIAQLRGESDYFNDFTNILNNNYGMNSSFTDLKTEGKKTVIDNAVYDINIFTYNHLTIHNFDNIYLRNGVMSGFDGSTWTCNEDVPPFTTELYEGMPDNNFATGALMFINPIGSSSKNIVPIPNIAGSSVASRAYTPNLASYSDDIIYTLGTDNYAEGQIDYLYPEGLTADETFNMYTDFSYEFPLRAKEEIPAPLPEWNPMYLDYVNTTCTYVPNSTRDQILAKNVLPQWYMDILTGKSNLTDAEKVNAVMNYVYSLKTYDTQTDYAPDDEDFVAWFLADSPSGYCVHFATSAAVLLRMIGVPTRYVSGYSIGTTANFNKINLTTAIDTDSFDSFDHTALPPDMGESILDAHNEDLHNTFEFYDQECYMYTVGERDAHAWCEFFDPEYGWVGFDPTNNCYVPGTRNFVPSNYLPPKAENPTVTSTNTPEVTATKKPENNTLVEPTENPEILTEQAFEFNENYIPAIIGILLLLGLVLARIIYIVIWNRKFKNGSDSDKVRSYCRYANFLRRNTTLPANMIELTNNAMYSPDGSSSEEVAQMRDATSNFIKEVLSNASIAERVLMKLFVVVPL